MALLLMHATGTRWPLADGVTRVGGAPDSDVCLDGDGVLDHHAELISDRRGLILKVADGARCHVNLRPVLELALIHPGDAVAFATVAATVQGQSPPRELSAQPTTLRPITRGFLIGRTGPFGGERFEIGATPFWPVAAMSASRPGASWALPMAVIEDGKLVVRAPRGRQIDINGYPVEAAVVSSGDQVAFDGAHYLIEAGRGDFAGPLWMRSDEAPEDERVVADGRIAIAPPPVPAASKPPGFSARWLLLAAIVIGALIAALLMFN